MIKKTRHRTLMRRSTLSTAHCAWVCLAAYIVRIVTFENAGKELRNVRKIEHKIYNVATASIRRVLMR